jgi:hypothetical protein
LDSVVGSRGIAVTVNSDSEQRQRTAAANSGSEQRQRQRSASSGRVRIRRSAVDDTHLRLLVGTGSIDRTTRTGAALGLFDEVRAMTRRLINPRE